MQIASHRKWCAELQLRHQIVDMTRRIVEQERVYHRKEVPECLRDRVEAARPAA
jgi:hypothetical protein